MEYSFQVENIRCVGCTNTITKNLKEIDGVEDLHVNVDEKQVIVTAKQDAPDAIREALSQKLLKLGYPEVGSKAANSLKTKATSVVSCAIGKVSSSN